MQKATKIYLIIATSFMIFGIIVFGSVMSMLKWNFRNLSTFKYETNNYQINQEYQDIIISTDTADVTFLPSEEDNTLVICEEQEKMKHTVEVKEGKLEIKLVDNRKWYEYIGFSFKQPKITVYLPQGGYGSLFIKVSTGDVNLCKELEFKSINVLTSTGKVTNYASSLGEIKIETSTGKILIEDIFASSVDLKVKTGKVSVKNLQCGSELKIKASTGTTNLEDVSCENLTSVASTGSIKLINVTATEKFSITRSTGDVKFDKCDAREIVVETDTGDVTGTLLSEKVFFANSDTGRVDVPKTINGGRCEITTDTGDIKINIVSR